MSAKTVAPPKRDLISSPQVHPAFGVVHRNPPLFGEPEWVVYSGETRAESVGVFYSQIDASDYAAWRNQKP